MADPVEKFGAQVYGHDGTNPQRLGVTSDRLNVQVQDGASVSAKALPLVTNANSTLTLTNANTAYQPTAPAAAYLLVVCNNSDTDMFWGMATLTSGGILIAKSGGTFSILCAASKAPFFYCTSAGKILNYTTTVV